MKILATVEVNFRFPSIRFDEKTERRRTDFNVALQTFNRPAPDAKAIERAVKSMQDLSRQNFPPAMLVVGVWETTGEHVPKDAEHGLSLIQKAAAKNYGPALYEIAIRQIEGRDLPKEYDRGLQMMRDASTLGSTQAQYYLGHKFEKGDGVPRDSDRARRYFRLCAAQRIAECQYRLARLLVDAPDRPERDFVQGVAWLQLAAEQGLPEAKEAVSRERANLTPAQTSQVEALRTQLTRK